MSFGLHIHNNLKKQDRETGTRRDRDRDKGRETTVLLVSVAQIQRTHDNLERQDREAGTGTGRDRDSYRGKETVRFKVPTAT